MSTVIKGSASGQINLNDTTGSIQLNGSDVLTIDSSGNLTVPNNLTVTGTPPSIAALSTASGSAPSYSARAWVKFNGTGTPAIIGSGNVSSITDIGTGTQTVNFTTAMSDTNYAAIVTTTWASGVTEYVTGLIYHDSPYAPATTSVTTKTYNFGTAGAIDSSIVMLAVFR